MPDPTVLETPEARQSTDLPLEPRRPAPGLPLIAIAGASGKTSTGWLLIDLLERSHAEVAAWLSDGVYVDRNLRLDELHAWELATLATRAREIDVMVQEVPSVLAANLPANSTWIAVLTSICGSDDQCQREAASGRDRSAVESVCAAVRGDGRIVANADDLMIVESASSANCPVIYYAMNGGNPVLRNHVEAGGDAVWIQNGWVKAQIAGTKSRLIQTTSLPASLDGHLIFQVQNALAAVASFAAIRGMLPDISALSERAGGHATSARHAGVAIHSDGIRTVVEDEPGSLLAVKQLVRGVRSFGPRRVIHLLGELRRLSDNEAGEAARVVGSLGGIAILTIDGEEDDRTAQIKEGLMNSVNPPAIVVRERSETTLAYIRSLLDAGDVALVLDSGLR